MIGLVFVTHSAALAAGVAELAAQAGGEGVRIAVAGGLDQPGRPLGTDATAVARAIDEVWSEDGVLVLMDLGSAVLSAEMALDLLPEGRRVLVRLSEAPLVEGAVAAAVAAALGEPLAAVDEAARDGLAAKTAQLAPAAAPGVAAGVPAAAPALPSGMLAGAGETVRVPVANRLGLHARPAALMARTAGSFDADVRVRDLTSGRGPVSARSLSGVAGLGARRGHELLLEGVGPQAHEALAALRRLAERGFGDPADESGTGASGAAAAPGLVTIAPAGSAADDGAAVPQAPAPGAVLTGLPAAPGVALGAARRLHPATPIVPDAATGSPEAEWEALERALAATADEVRAARDSIAGRAGDYEAAIFDAHLLFLQDEAVLGPARRRVQRGDGAARAWSEAVASAAAVWEELDDAYLRARAADLRAVGDQVLRHLAGRVAAPALAGAGIVVAADLTPAETAALDRAVVAGVACARGGPTSHAAILARSLGIPAVVGAGDGLLGVPEGTALVLDGAAGTVVVDPSADVKAAALARVAAQEQEAAAALVAARAPAATRDGVFVRVEANVAGPQEVPAAVAAGADGIGLLRTEFLFLDAVAAPGEEEQVRAYRAAAAALGGRPLTIRTLDAGADKPLAFLPCAPEQNPFLGIRGIRLGLAHPALLATQLRAILRVAADHPVRLLFPMVASVDEVARVRELLERERDSLRAGGVAVPAGIETGIMVEVPAAALLAERLAATVDFFSLGTNDLTQYTLAADRGNAAVAALGDALHPAVLRLIEHTATAAAGRPVAVCGELAGDPLAVPLLIGLGVRELSMAAARIAAAKEAVRATDTVAARGLARAALAAASAAEVRALCGERRGA